MRSVPYRFVAMVVVAALLSLVGFLVFSAKKPGEVSEGRALQGSPLPPSPAASLPPGGAAAMPVSPASQDAGRGNPMTPSSETAAAIDPLGARELQRIGRTSPIDPHAPGAASVAEALKTGTHPERLSLAFAPVPFEQSRFDADPVAYLSVVEPGRVFQTKTPGPEVPVLGALAPLTQQVEQGGQVELAVRTAPLAPVSFTSLDLGTFVENTLVAITVRADEQGAARVHLKAGPGTSGEISILAGSPVASGQIRFVVMVTLPPHGQAQPASGSK